MRAPSYSFHAQPTLMRTAIAMISLALGLISTPAYSEITETAEEHAQHSTHNTEPSGLPSIANTSKARITYKYVCPMHPQIVKGHEGSCPICGMDLVKKAFEASSGSPKINAQSGNTGNTSNTSAIQHAFAIRTTVAQKTTLWKYIETYGKVVPNENKVFHVHPRASGWMSQLSVRDNGEAIKKGQLLYRLYSPELVSAQQDYILAVKNQQRLNKLSASALRQQSAASLTESSAVRLQLLGVADSVISVIKQRLKPIQKLPFYAKQSGVIENLNTQEGMYIQPSMELMSIVDLSNVWVEADVLPLQQNWVANGDTVAVSSDIFPDTQWESRITYLYPRVDAQTQSLKIRIPLKNSDGRLKPNHLMDVVIYSGPKRNVIAIPIEAIIDDGHDKRIVKQLPSGLFQVVPIVTGMETRGTAEVFSGVEEGDKIVISGQFLIDSESQIQTNIRRLIAGE